MALGVATVFWAIAAILGVLWVMGMISGAGLGAWVHLFLVFALVAMVLGVSQTGRLSRRATRRGAL